MLFRIIQKLYATRRQFIQSHDASVSACQKRSQFILLLVAGLQFFGPPSAWTETNQPSEYQVKASYLYNFAKFVEWPSEASDLPPPTFIICILGKSPFGDALDSISGKAVRGRRVAITHINRIEELKECDILFVGASERIRLGQILASVNSRPILTISDIKRCAAAGTMIGFVPAGDTIKFEINHRAVQRAGLRISAHLLKLARVVVE